MVLLVSLRRKTDLGGLSDWSWLRVRTVIYVIFSYLTVINRLWCFSHNRIPHQCAKRKQLPNLDKRYRVGSNQQQVTCNWHLTFLPVSYTIL